MGTSQLPEIGSTNVVGALKDFKQKNRSSGNITLSSTSWADVDTTLDLVLTASAGDVVEYELSGNVNTGSAAVGSILDVATIVGGSPVNYFSGGVGAVGDFGVSGWYQGGVNNGDMPIGGGVRRTLTSSDISSGTVTLRLRYRVTSAGSRTLYANSTLPFHVEATNLGQVGQSSPLIGTTVWIKQTVRSGGGNYTTTSTTRTPIDATNLPYVTRDLAVGDLVKLSLFGKASNNTNNFGVFFDFEVDQPTSANVYVASAQDYGIVFLYQPTANVPFGVAVTATFVATEAGTHGFRPVWAAEGNTATLHNAASGGSDNLITYLVEHWPVAIVG